MARIQVPSCWTAGNRSTVVPLRCTNLTCAEGMLPENRESASTWFDRSHGDAVLNNSISGWFEPLAVLCLDSASAVSGLTIQWGQFGTGCLSGEASRNERNEVCDTGAGVHGAVLNG